MNLIMCRSCGHFVNAATEDEGLVPIREECPQCGGTSFRESGSDRTVDTIEG